MRRRGNPDHRILTGLSRGGHLQQDSARHVRSDRQSVCRSSGLAMMKLYPAAQRNQHEYDHQLLERAGTSIERRQVRRTGDHNFSTKDSVFGRFSYDQADSFVPGGSPGFAEANAFASTSEHHQSRAQCGDLRNPHFHDRNINQFTFGFNRIFNHIRSFGDRNLRSGQHRNSGCESEQQVSRMPQRDCQPVDQRLHELRPELHPDEQLLGAWAIAGLLPSRVEPTFSPSLTPST